jgi:hypothetical protein
MLFALGQLRAHTGRGVKRPNAGTGSAHALGQRALRHQFGVNLAIIVHARKGRDLGGMRGGCKGTDHLFHLAGSNQGAYIHFRVHRTGVVRDAGELFGALPVQRRQQIAWQANPPEARGHEDRAVGDIRHGFIKGAIDFILHACVS